MSASSSSLVLTSSPLVPDDVKTTSSLVPGVWDEETRSVNNINNYQDQGRTGAQMANPQKTKGSAAERAVVTYLQTRGWPHAERRLAGSSKDRGDVAGVPGIVIEVKDCGRSELPGWLDEAHLEAANDHADHGVVWHKRRGRGNAADWFVTMSGADFTTLLAAAGYGGQPHAARSAGATQERTEETAAAPSLPTENGEDQ